MKSILRIQPPNNKGCCEVGAIAETSSAPLVGPGGAPLCPAHGVTVFTQMGGQEAAQRVDDGGGHGFAPAFS